MPTLDWIGKKAVLNHHNEVPFRLLKCRPELSVGDPGSGNLLIQGDNLEALKALLPYYAGKVKCIYIDPPYNTGNENWIYNDAVNSPEMKAWLGKVVGKEAEDLSRHDKWLCMMYPRLSLLRNTLTIDGVIIISIDDFEVHNLRCLLNEIFGPVNYIATLVWDKTRKNDAKLFSVGHEYLVVFAKSLATLRKLGITWRESKPGSDTVREKFYELRSEFGSDWLAIENGLREWYRSLPNSEPAKKLSRYKNVDDKGVWRDRDISWPGGNGPRYDVIHPATGKPCKVPERGWGFATTESMQEQILNGLVQFRADETEPPFRKAYLWGNGDDDSDSTGEQVMPSVIHKQAQVSVRALREMFAGRKVFENPKDHEVIMRLLRYVTGPNDTILDSFAGSGTTGHAVLQINKESNSNRKFVMVELDSDIYESVTCERLRRAIAGYDVQTESGEQVRVAGLGGGFRSCRLGATLFDDTGLVRSEVSFTDLAHHVFFTETGEPLPKPNHKKSPLLAIASGVAVYLLYNGILLDKSPNGGNALTTHTLELLPKHDGPKVIFGTSCRLSTTRLKRENITFRQIPYQVKVR